MRIYVPFTLEHPPTRQAVGAWPWGATLVAVDGGDGYLRYFCQRWEEARPFINVEHDVVPALSQLADLLRCPDDWCCFPEYREGPPSLSLVRFRPSFIEANAGIWDPLTTRRSAGVNQPTWQVLDSWLVAHADRKPHLHGPPWVRNDRPNASVS